MEFPISPLIHFDRSRMEYLLHFFTDRYFSEYGVLGVLRYEP
jgi:hypothetical protein